MRQRVSWILILVFHWVFTGSLSDACAQDGALPVGTVPVGDSPFALAISADSRQAVVVNLFPEASDATNVKLVDLDSQTVSSRLRVGTRLVAVAITGTRALVVNEDQDFVIVVDLNTVTEITRIRVGSRPSNVTVANELTAVVTNGTSGDLSFIDLQTNELIGDPVSVGSDPRDVAIHPSGDYAYVALGGDDAVAVVDLRVFTTVATVSVGKDPVAVELTPNGQRAVVANLSNSTVSVLDLSDPAFPRVIPTPSGSSQIPVGVQPSALAISPDGQTAYVSNLGSNWLTAVDIEARMVAGVVRVERPDPNDPTRMVTSATSGIRVSPDGTRLLVTEFRNDAQLLIYDLTNLPLEPAPEIEVPGEPRASIFLDTIPGLPCPGFYIAEISLREGAGSGFWGMEVLTTSGARLLQGGINLGGGFDADAGNPGFGAFNIANTANEAQIVNITVQAQALPTEGFSEGNLGLSVRILKSGTQVGESVSGSLFPLQLSNTLDPGFYVVEIKSLSGSPRGTYQMAMESSFTNRPGGAFQGGVNVGGFITRDSAGNSLTGFVAFCISDAQTINIRTLGGTEFGDAGAGDLVLTLLDAGRQVIRSVDNSIPTSTVVRPPDAPDLEGVIADIFVDASATPGGNGSSSNPFRSITTALSEASSGDVILVQPGVYSPSTTGEVIPIGSAGPNLNPIRSNVTILGSGAESTIIDAEGAVRSDGNGNAVVLAASNVRFSGFTVRNADQIGVLVFNASGVWVDKNLFTSNGRFGFGSIKSPGLVVIENVAVANRESGIVVTGSQVASLTNAPDGCPSSFGACIINNISNDNRADGILGSAGGNLYVLNNITNNNGSSGIELNNRADPEQPANPPLVGYIKNNSISNNGGVQFAFAGTGILVTEGALAEEISDNDLVNNRPFGIGIFLNGSANLIARNKLSDTQSNAILVQRNSTVTEISDNVVINSGLSGLFVENEARVTRILGNTSTGNGTCTVCTDAKAGLAVLAQSQVETVDNNIFDQNAVGMEVAGSSKVTSLMNNSFVGNDQGGVLVRETSELTDFNNNTVRVNRGIAGIAMHSSAGTISNSQITGNRTTAVRLFSGSAVTLLGNTIENNEQDGGVVLEGGSTATLTDNIISGNEEQGILAADSGTLAKLTGGNSVTNNQGIGLNAQNGGKIECEGQNTISGNTGGNVLGDISGCQ